MPVVFASLISWKVVANVIVIASSRLYLDYGDNLIARIERDCRILTPVTNSGLTSSSGMIH